ncbi:MAG: 5-(carboxyamino)imidazole ribonucleotide mutase [Candidatus Tectomicrobia bacterium]|uniref:N5-carboxyaminoimidazole ribonucleotide mutase n=1 Tax=Tectimicrobiota bacterium TaxID=2528274 RepID=A0A932GQH4_UNCTE|nr:5-(carboxyamino)imidazole ribonucleotide mutase [Candidatus Tectomicrobia bacterium]
MAGPKVGVVMGSTSDQEIMEECLKALDEFGVPYELTVSSAHRSPARTSEYARRAAERGVQVLIAGAGGAAHLAGVLAAETILPVIGVPIDSSPLQGFDALLATVQMPRGTPVATMAVGKSGARNAGILAVQILALSDPDLSQKLRDFKQKMSQGVEEADRKLKGKRGG